MKAIKFLVLGILAGMMASCSSEDIAINKEVSAKITGNIGTSLKTRAHDTTWDEKDQIGLFVFDAEYAVGVTTNKIYREINDNRPFITVGGGNSLEFTPNDGKGAVPFPSDGSSIYFKSYYPYTSSITAANPIFTVTSWDQETPAASRALDLLVTNIATKEAEYTKEGYTKDDLYIGGKEAHMQNPQPNVDLKFRHIFSRLVLNIKPNSKESQILEDDLIGLTATATGMSATATYDVLNGGEISKEPNEEETFNLCADEDGQKVVAIICPQYNTGTENRIVKFKLADTVNEEGMTIPGKTYTWKIPTEQEFLPGTSYTWSIKLRGDELAEGTLIGTIIEWDEIEGGEEDLDFDKSEPETQP